MRRAHRCSGVQENIWFPDQSRRFASLVRETNQERIGGTGMDKLWTIDWQAVFVPALGLSEIVLRGTLMYLALFLILRFMSRRQSGHLSPSDLLVIVLIADAAQN